MEMKVIKFKCFCTNIFLLLSIAINLISTKRPKIDVVAEIGLCEEKVNPDVFVEGCEYKLQLSLKILNAGQTANTTEYLKIDKAYDKKSGKDVRLYNTVVLQIRQEQVSFVYPFHKIGLVNNKAYEVFVTKDNTDDFVGCDKFSLPGLCGYAIVGANPQKEVVVKQKGFCCPCLKDAQQTGRYHLRGGQDCTNKTAGDAEKDTYHSSAHCLKFDPVWYSVNEFGTPHLEHLIHVTAFVVDAEKEQRSWQFMGGENEILLGPESRYVSTKNGMISATYIDGSFAQEENLINYTHKHLLIPRLNPVLMEKIMPLQIKEGPSRYLLLDHEMIDMTGESCDKAGVSYAAFVNQENKCTSLAQSCLDKQPMHYWLEDVQNHNAGRRGKYFLSNYAKLSPNPILRNTETEEENLVVMVTQPHLSILYFEINADDLMPLHEGITAQISEVYIGPICGNQQQVFVDVLNRGCVTAVFHTTLVKCENATAADEDDNAMKIEPHESKQYVLTLKGNRPDKETETASCIVQVLNEADSLVAAREIQFRLGERCICEAHCHCECLTSALVCRPMTQEEYHVAGFRGLAPSLMSHSPHVGYQVALVFVVICFLLFLLGICKGLLGFVVPAVGQLGLSLFITNKRLPRYYEKELWGMTVVYNDEGIPVHPVSGQAVRRMGLGMEACLNVVFFFYLPLVGVHYCILNMMMRNSNKQKVDYQPKNSRPELPSVDEESQEEEDEPIYESVFTPAMMKAKAEKKTSLDSQDYLIPSYHGSNITNHEELFSQDSGEDSGDSLKKRRSKRKGSQQKKTSDPDIKLSEIAQDSDIHSSSTHSSRKHSKSSQNRKDSTKSGGSEINSGSGRSSKSASRSSTKSKEGKLDEDMDDIDRVKTGSAHTLNTLSSLSSKSNKGKLDPSIQDVEESSESGQSSRQLSAAGSDQYPGSARKYSIPLSQRTLRGSLAGSKIGSLIFKKDSSSENSSLSGNAGQGSLKDSIQSASASAATSNRSSKLSSLSGKSTAYDEVLKLAKSGKRVYYNFNKADERIAGLGNVYSLCGCLHVQGGAFVFDLDIHNVQVYSNEGGRRQELDAPRELNSDDFRRVMSAEECLQVITLFPMHPCLNKVLINESDSGGSIENTSIHSMFFSDH